MASPFQRLTGRLCSLLMTDIERFLPDEAATRRLGAKLGASLAAGDVICLTGPLGAGKTTLARAIINTAAGASEAPSPTFSLVETYPAGAFSIWHFDLYRLEKAEDVWELGLEEALEEGACLIEWPERIEKFLPGDLLVLALKADGDARHLTIRAGGDWFDRLDRAGIA